MCLFFALASFARADLTDQQVKDYVRNTWEITDLILAQAGLTGVSAVAQLAVWPIEHALLNF